MEGSLFVYLAAYIIILICFCLWMVFRYPRRRFKTKAFKELQKYRQTASEEDDTDTNSDLI